MFLYKKGTAFLLTTVCLVFFLSACEPSDSGAGQKIYETNCRVCHAQGISGAPIVGNKKVWGPRIEQGHETLLKHATEGFGLMPAKGGKTELSNDDVSLAIQYMVQQSR